jgi:hypothetical protein
MQDLRAVYEPGAKYRREGAKRQEAEIGEAQEAEHDLGAGKRSESAPEGNGGPFLSATSESDSKRY